MVGRPGSAEPATSPAVTVDASTGEPPPPQEMGTQTDLLATNREVPVVNFLNADECELRESNIPNCFHFASRQWYIKSPRIPIVVEGIRVPILVDTGAEVSVLSTEFVQRLFPEQDIPTGTRQVRALEGQLLTLKGLLKLKVEISELLLEHPFYYYDKNPTFLMGFDLISAAALIIDPANRCVWSKITASTPPASQQSTHFGASVPPFPSLLPAAEDFDSDDSDSDASPPRSPPSPPPPSPVSPSADPLLHSGVVRRLSLIHI